MVIVIAIRLALGWQGLVLPATNPQDFNETQSAQAAPHLSSINNSDLGPANDDSVEILEHADHWHDDGDTLLQTGHTQFRVHAALLQHSSAWFKHAIHLANSGDSLNAPASIRTTPARVKVSQQDGLPLLHIDAARNSAVPSADDFALVLDMIYFGQSFIQNPLSLVHAMALHKAATYYSMPQIVCIAKTCIELAFPVDFFSLESRPIPRLPELALLVGDRFNIPSIQRRACYDLARLSVADFSRACQIITTADITIPASVDGPEKVIKIQVDEDPMTPARIKSITILQKHLAGAWAQLLLVLRSQICDVPGGDCPLKCRQVLLERAADVMSDHPLNPLQGVRILGADSSIKNTTCKSAQDFVSQKTLEAELNIVHRLQGSWIALGDGAHTPTI